ncbi:ABC transporter ATP-binding protein [Sediminivirga luteola]|nr:ABC transporter ATP-binding protein [Sediminivirga luteola]
MTTTQTAASISLEGLAKTFGGQPAVAGLDLSLPPGAFLVLLGPSGCGKTTTLRMIAGLEDPTSGRIRFGDRVIADGGSGLSVPAERRGIGMVFQSYALWPHMTVRANVEWPLKVDGWSAADRRARVQEVLAMLGIDQLAGRHPAQLSGGQQQRVAIARTVAPRPKVLLFDEPLSNLDARLRVDTRAELVQVHLATGATSVYVTHDQIEALAMATHIAVLRGGRLEQFGTPDDLLQRPRTAFVAEFLGSPSAVLLEGEVRGGTLRSASLGGAALAGGLDAPEGTVLTAMYRPERLVLAAAEGEPAPEAGAEVTVLEATPSAGRFVVTVAAGAAGRFSVVAEQRIAVGAKRRLVLPPAPDALFDAAGDRWEPAG